MPGVPAHDSRPQRPIRTTRVSPAHESPVRPVRSERRSLAEVPRIGNASRCWVGSFRGGRLKLQPYLRVSTDDKGQDPIRQMNRLEPWAEREKATLLPPVVDEGTSATKTRPFDRPKFLEAVHQAKTAGARGIIVEEADRLTRKGTKAWFAAIARLEDEHGLKLYTADVDLKLQESTMGDLYGAMKAALGKEQSDQFRARVLSGLARARAKGKRIGRPPKPFLPQELDYARALRAQGQGWERVAHAINEARGVFKIAQPDVRKRRQISPTALRTALAVAAETPKPAETPARIEGSI